MTDWAQGADTGESSHHIGSLRRPTTARVGISILQRRVEHIIKGDMNFPSFSRHNFLLNTVIFADWYQSNGKILFPIH
jgi:hypothetical protein